MNKKLLIALTSLAVVLSCTALGLWWTVKGKNELTMRHTDKLAPRFTKESPAIDPEFMKRMSAIDRSFKRLTEAEAEVEKLTGELATERATVARQVKEIAELNADKKALGDQLAETTRIKEELQKKSDELQSALTRAENKVKEQESQIAKDAEEHLKKIEEMQAKFDAEKSGMMNDTRIARDFYTKLYNFSTSRGLELPKNLGARPWAGAEANQGPKFANNSVMAQIVDFEPRLGFVVLNIGGDAGLIRDQVFDIYVSEVVVGRLRIGDILNGAVSSGYLMKGTDNSKIAVGTPVKLIPVGTVLP